MAVSDLEAKMLKRKMVTATSLSLSALKALDRVAKSKGRTNASVLRTAVYEYLRREGEEFDPGEDEEVIEETTETA
jgi:predicted DNA-binding protein